MAAPHVSGVVSLMLSANAALTPAQVLQQLQASARAFPVGTANDCRTTTCGAGIVDAAAALGAPPVSPRPRPGRVNLALASNGAPVDRVEHLQRPSYPPSAVINGDRRGATGPPAAAGTTPRREPGRRGSRSISARANGRGSRRLHHPGRVTQIRKSRRRRCCSRATASPTSRSSTGPGSAWQTVTGGSVTGNNKVWRKFTFPRRFDPLRAGADRRLRRRLQPAHRVEAYATADTPPPVAINFAAQANGGVASASSTHAGYPASRSTTATGAASVGDFGRWLERRNSRQLARRRPGRVQRCQEHHRIDVFTIQDAYADPQEPAGHRPSANTG